MEAAAQVFSREGLAATTNRIAERAGTSIGTLYQYFPDKLALLHAVAQRHLREGDRQLTDVAARLRDERPPFEETMRTLLEAVVAVHRDRPALHALLHRMAPRSVEEFDALTALEDRLIDEVAFHLKRCDRGGDDFEGTARTIVHSVDAQVHRVMTRRGFDVDALVGTVIALAPPRR